MGDFKYKTIIPDVEFWKGIVPCQAACPVNTDAGRYVQLIAQGRYEDATSWRVRRIRWLRSAGASAPRPAKTAAAAASSVQKSAAATATAKISRDGQARGRNCEFAQEWCWTKPRGSKVVPDSAGVCWSCLGAVKDSSSATSQLTIRNKHGLPAHENVL